MICTEFKNKSIPVFKLIDIRLYSGYNSFITLISSSERTGNYDLF